ncbi:MAG TPA: hypothetical protein DCL73_10335 [Treponema sp.]|nr:hypothetical protein [Treponema sp.]
MKALIQAEGMEITVISNGNDKDYISLTDIAKYKSNEPNDVIKNWLRRKDTIEFLGFKNAAGSNSFTLAPQKWIESTKAIGLISKSGRYGGTFAYKDIAFEFASWVSAEFKLYIIKDYERLKADENSRLSVPWNVNRMISKINYKIHTDAIRENLTQSERLVRLNRMAISQMKSLLGNQNVQRLEEEK